MLFAILIVPPAINAKSLWQDKNLYASGDSLKVGDIVIVEIDDMTRLKFTLALQDKTSSGVTSNPDTNITGFLPKVSAEKKSNQGTTTDVSSTGTIKISIAAQVTQKRPDGTFQISGTREYSFNGNTNRFTVTGIVDPKLIQGRSVASDNVVNFRLDIRGAREGAGIAIKREAPKEGQPVKADLTEQEKQQLIIDYLQKIIGELSR